MGLSVVAVLAALPLMISLLTQFWLAASFSEILGAQFDVARVWVNPFTGRVSLHDLRLAQPPGFNGPSLAEIRVLTGTMSFKSLLRQRVKIEKMAIEDGFLQMRFDPESGLNIRSLPVFNRSQPQKPNPAKPSKSRWRAEIGRIDATNLTVSWTEGCASNALAALELHCVKITNLSVGKASRLQTASFADVCIEGVWRLGGSAASSFNAAGWVGPVNGGIPEGALDLSMQAWQPHDVLSVFFPMPGVVDKNAIFDVFLAAGFNDDGVDVTGSMFDSSKHQIARVGHVFYSWNMGFLEAGDLRFDHPDILLPRPLLALQWGVLSHCKTDRVFECSLDLRNPVFTWVVASGAGAQNLSRENKNLSRQQDMPKRSRIKQLSYVLQNLFVTNANIACLALSSKGECSQIACVSELRADASNVVLGAACENDAGDGKLRLACMIEQAESGTATMELNAVTMPGRSGWRPIVAATGIVAGLKIPGFCKPQQQKTAVLFVPTPITAEWEMNLKDDNLALALRARDAAGSEILTAQGLCYDLSNAEGRLNILALRQPPGFGSGRLLLLKNLAWRMTPGFWKSRRLNISDGSVSGIEATLARNAQGVLNIAALQECFCEKPSGDVEKKSYATTESAAIPAWSVSVERFALTNAILLLNNDSVDAAQQRKLVSFWGVVSNAAFAQEVTSTSPPLRGVMNLAGVLRQAPDEDASFEMNLNFLLPKQGSLDVSFSSRFEQALVATFGTMAPTWCRALFGETPLSGKLDARLDRAGLSASGRIADAHGATAVGFESLDWNRASDEWRVKSFDLALPETFGTNSLLKVDDARVRFDEKWDGRSLFRVNEVEIKNVAANLARDADGVWNWEFVRSPPAASGAKSITREKRARRGFPGVALKKIRFEHMSMRFEDRLDRDRPALLDVDILSAKGSDLILGRALAENPLTGVFQVDASLPQTHALPARLCVEGRMEAAKNCMPEWYATANISAWSPRDLFAPQGRILWERDIGQIDLAACVAWSSELADAVFEARTTDGKLLAACGSLDWLKTSGELRLRNLQASSPPASKLPPVLNAPEALFIFDPATFAAPPVLIKEFYAKTPALHLARNRFGERNTDYLAALLMFAPSTNVPETIKTDRKPVFLPLEHALIDKMSIKYEDNACGREGIKLSFSNIDADIRHLPLSFGAAIPERRDGRAHLRAQIEQRDASPGKFDLKTDIRIAPDGDCEIDADLALIGLAPAGLGGYLPPALARGLKRETLALLLNATASRNGFGVSASLDTFSGRTLAAIGSIDYSRYARALLLTDLFVAQPPGFGEGPIIVAPSVYARFGEPCAADDPLTVEELECEGAGFFPVRNKEGALNLKFLAGLFQTAPFGNSKELQPGPGSGVLLKHLGGNNLFGMYTDYSANRDVPTVIRVDNAEALGANFRWGGIVMTQPEKPGEFGFAARLVQSPLCNGYAGGLARFSPLGRGTPALKAVVRIAGLELPTLAGWLPANTSELLGGDAVDVAANLEIAPDRLACDLDVATCSDTRFSLAFRGTPQTPKLDTSSVLYGILVRAGGGLGATFRHVAGAGFDAVRSTIQATYKFGEGAWRVLGSVGNGLYNTVHGMVTADLQEVASGFTQATVGTVSETADAFFQSGESLISGAVRTATYRSRTAQEWRENNMKRWFDAWQNARQTMGVSEAAKAEGQ